MNDRIARVQNILKANAINTEIKIFEESTKTALEASQALGCELGQITKSLVFKTKETNQPILVLTSGANRVSLAKLEAILGMHVEKADADFVKEVSGFEIGGVAPLGFLHEEDLVKIIDVDLTKYPTIYPSAGSSKSVFSVTPDDLIALTNAKIEDIKE